MCAGEGAVVDDADTLARQVNAQPPACDGDDSCDPAWPGGRVQYTPPHSSSAQISTSASSTVNIIDSIGSARTMCKFRGDLDRAQSRVLGAHHCDNLAQRAHEHV